MDTPKYGETLKFVYIKYQPILIKSYQRFTKFKGAQSRYFEFFWASIDKITVKLKETWK